jgi:hypothetical protein
MKTKSILLQFIFIVSITTLAMGQQIQMPQASPTATISQKIGLTDVSIEYSRPSTKGRKIFGELVQFGEVWRTGANAATIINFKNEVKVEGNIIPAGSYALYSIPDKNEWTIILSKNTKLWGAVGYDAKDDLIRFKVKPGKTGQKYETMEINFVDMTDTGATIAMKWETTRVKFRIETEVDRIVMAEIKALVIDKEAENPGLLYQAANYYFTNNKDMNLAYDWITKSVSEDPKYWTMHLKAKIELALGKKKEAIEKAVGGDDPLFVHENPLALDEEIIKRLYGL